MHKFHKKPSKRKAMPVGEETGDIYSTWYIYLHKCLFIIFCTPHINSYEDGYTYRKGYRYIWRWERTEAT